MARSRLSKALLFSLFFLFHLFADTEGQVLPSISPDDVEIAWDIHGVLMYQPLGSIVNNIEYREIFSLFPPAAKGALLSLFDDGLTTTEQELICKACELVRAGDISGEGFYWLFKKYGFDKLAEMTRRLADAYCPYPGIEALVQELDQLGYTQRIASNIGSNFYENLKKVHPDLFSYFKGGTTVQYEQSDGSINFDPIRKPNRAYIQQYEAHNPDHKPYKIFIDDRIANVKGLRGHDWITLKFTSTPQLRQDLMKLGIPLGSSPQALMIN